MISGYCEEHGPYDGASCPYCVQSSNVRHSAAPQPLFDEDDLPTELPGSINHDVFFDNGVTEPPVTQRGGVGFLDDDITVPPRGFDEDELDVTVLEHPPTGVLGLLWVKSGPRRGRHYDVKDGTVVGRKEGSIRLNDELVSKSHARFRVENGEFVLWDLGSSNGTYVNGDRIRAATPLKDGDEIRIGSTTFVFKVLPED